VLAPHFNGCYFPVDPAIRRVPGPHLQEFAVTSLPAPDSFVPRHVGPSDDDVRAMLAVLGHPTLDALVQATIPAGIRAAKPLALPAGISEQEALTAFRRMMSENEVGRSFIGLGYSTTHLPAVIQRNVLENPGWYTAYTPYQAEIAQGRLEALLNFQTVVADLTALPVASASLLDEATAAAEAMQLVHAAREGRGTFLVADHCHPQTIDVVKTRAGARGITVKVQKATAFTLDATVCGVLVQYPDTFGAITDLRALADRAHAAGALVVAATDLLALTLLVPPGEWGADVAVGNAQRFGVPLGYGGPHAAFFSTRDEFKRLMPGRIIGLSKDAHGKPALRMALGTREQHIRREKATSNICTAQVLLAVMAGLYAVWHGPDGLRRIATRVHRAARAFAAGVRQQGHAVIADEFFDTVHVRLAGRTAADVRKAAEARRLQLRHLDDGTIAVSFGETVTSADLTDLLGCFGRTPGVESASGSRPAAPDAAAGVETSRFARTSAFLTHPVFHAYRSETEMMRYLRRLESRDLSLTHSMIPLGSCTMKLNAAAEMLPVTWPEVGGLHPFAPVEQARGYRALFDLLERSLAEITGFHAVSLQPNAGSQGEYTGLLVIRAYHASRNESHRDVCLIPQSAHGTNPASAVMAGMNVVVVKTDALGNIDVADLEARAAEHAARLGALMVTYPSTHGVFEEAIIDICRIVHRHGGQVYMDGANMNAMVGLCRPADIGADVCHLNLHKTFCIPHGGGGPGVGPIGVAKHLAPFLPGHTLVPTGGTQAIGAVSAAPWGSASILPISAMYVMMMGGDGLTQATKVAILNANYLAKRLEPHFPVLYRGRNGTVAHECIVDPRGLKAASGVDVEDIAKRLMDYGFHAPTISFPVPGTLMIEPTESESKAELDRFADALVAIRGEIADIANGALPKDDNPLKRAPHTLEATLADDWSRPYPRERAAFPLPWVRERKFWPAVGRVDNAYGDRHLVCTCPPVEEYATV
jgi:glycine dehydrogenase